MVSIGNYHSGYPEVLLTIWTTFLTHRPLVEGPLRRHGCADEIVMDNGPQFTSSKFQQFLTEYGVRALMMTIYNPRENGLVKCRNKMFKFGVQAFTSSGKQWDDGVPKLLGARHAWHLK